ncbi:MAG: hypothetical protein WCI77_02675 [Candidatus Omnitrophota bacterium]
MQKSRVDRWLEEFPLFSVTHRDGDGCMPKHTWFFSPHEDTEDHLERLTGLCKQGYGEIELHMHHDRILPFPDTSETFERKIREATDRYALLGLFGKDNRDDKRKFGFVHGDWALDNSRGGKFCGINNELQILAKCGCYADFTFPSICESQPQKINSIYYAFDDPRRPKSYDRGISVKVGKKKCGDLMIIQGPLGLHSKPYRRWPFIAIESANISLTDLPYPSRVDFWAKTGIGVEDKQEWIFIKVHTHGAYEPNADVLLGEHMHTMHSYLESKYNDGINFRLHYVTARELYNIVKAAESGEIGNPSQFRDYYIDKPPL